MEKYLQFLSFLDINEVIFKKIKSRFKSKLENKERYGLVEFICAATDCEGFLKGLNPEQPTWATQTGTMDDVFTTSAKAHGHTSLVVDQTMVEEIKINDRLFHVVHQNYIVGIIDE